MLSSEILCKEIMDLFSLRLICKVMRADSAHDDTVIHQSIINGRTRKDLDGVHYINLPTLDALGLITEGREEYPLKFTLSPFTSILFQIERSFPVAII